MSNHNNRFFELLCHFDDTTTNCTMYPYRSLVTNTSNPKPKIIPVHQDTYQDTFQKILDRTLTEPTECEAIQCSLCMTNKKNINLSCGHAYCSDCVKCQAEVQKWAVDPINRTCPDCRQQVKSISKLFL